MAAVLAMAVLTPHVAEAQQEESRLPITVYADSFEGQNSILVYHGLKVTQGSISLQADVGHTSGLDFENSVWYLSGNVIIDVRNGHLESEAADLTFENHQLQKAVITGSPATFRMQRPGSANATYAEAGKLVYDFAKGIVEFSGNATITEGGNRISSEYLVYNIDEQRIKAQSGGEGDAKVKITYTPEDPAEAATEDQATNQDEPAEEPEQDQDDPG
ncbi:MAG TPA: LptA/OstA family protein [Woeseiaceae bacterium]|nr:LptA/OstA family protein [Woeseiaceae bacterium]